MDDLGQHLLHPSRASQSADEVHVARHQRHPPGVKRAEVGVREEADEVGLAGLLKAVDGRSLPPELVPVGMPLHQQLSNETGEGSFAEEKVRCLLVQSDLSHSQRARSHPLRRLGFSPSL